MPFPQSTLLTSLAGTLWIAALYSITSASLQGLPPAMAHFVFALILNVSRHYQAGWHTLRLRQEVIVRKSVLFFLLFLFFGPISPAAAAHFSCTPTSISALVGIRASINPTLGNEPLQPGDEIGAFTPDGLCAGMVVWNGINTVLTVYGAEGEPTLLPGMGSGQPIAYRIWRTTLEREFTRTAVTYASGDGLFQANALFVLDSFSTTAHRLTIQAEPTGAGTISPVAGTYLYNPGDVVDLSAIAVAPYLFHHWSGGPVADSTAATTLILMDGPKSVQAHFRIYTGAAAPGPPAGFGLQIYPNPATSAVHFDLAITTPGAWSISLHNLAGQEVRRWNGFVAANNRLLWNGTDAAGSPLPSGRYFLLVRRDGHLLECKNLVLLR